MAGPANLVGITDTQCVDNTAVVLDILVQGQRVVNNCDVNLGT